MTSTDPAARNGHERRRVARDLSSVFGTAAAARSRPRIRRRRQRPPREPDPVDPEIVEDDVPERTRRQAPVGRVSRDRGAPARRRRFGVVKVRDRQHVDMLLLAAATKGPANGHEMIDRVREHSEGIFELPLGVVIRALHRLTTNRLVQVSGDGGVRRYSATPLGERVLATRRREWEAFSHGLDTVLDAVGEVGRRDAGRGRATRYG